MEHLIDLAPFLNLILIPTFGFVIAIERRLTRIEQKSTDTQGLRERRCPIETGTCPIARQRYRSSWIEPIQSDYWAKQQGGDNGET
jgi:hypothetical protein